MYNAAQKRFAPQLRTVGLFPAAQSRRSHAMTLFMMEELAYEYLLPFWGDLAKWQAIYGMLAAARPLGFAMISTLNLHVLPPLVQTRS
jgi:hypothetical protein